MDSKQTVKFSIRLFMHAAKESYMNDDEFPTLRRHAMTYFDDVSG